MSGGPSREFDLVVVGATPGGIACAVRGAREGLRVLLTNHNRHIGGLWSNGLGAIDAQYNGRRSPIFAECCDRLLAYYRERYGRDSEQYRSIFTKSYSRYAPDGPKVAADTFAARSAPAALPQRYYAKFNFEPHAAERMFDALVAAEPNLELWREWVPDSAERNGAVLEAVTFLSTGLEPSRRVIGRVFADCTYEGDLMALAGCAYRVGRESRSEYGEPHAGRIFTALHFATPKEVGFPREAVEGKLNLEPYEAISQQIFAGSTGEGDKKIQAYTFRLCLCDAPPNRLLPQRPANYDRELFLRMRNRWSIGSPIPNHKLKWNTSNLPGGNWDYPDASRAERRAILERHRDHALGFLWFLQNDEAVPASLRETAQRYGLARDEFEDNGHIPWEMYVREARRLVGRYVFKEQDAAIAPGLQRAPIHRDSIAITDWGMDSHSVSMEMVPGSRREGKILLTELTRPGQVPWRCVLPAELDNLLVPVCLSATHVGWGTIRLEPTWMHVAESAAFAAVLAIEQNVPPAKLKVGQLQRRLVRRGVMISFFNEFTPDLSAPWAPAVQFLGAKWFFSSYDARPDDPLDPATARIWAGIAADIATGRHRHLEEARWAEIYPAAGIGEGMTGQQLQVLMKEEYAVRSLPPEKVDAVYGEFESSGENWTRGDACRFFYELLDGARAVVQKSPLARSLT